ncbi:MAG: hypothetical protein KTR32_15805 [Granulosicoccus sp.]|nr:hypothetical protein [Granulosicoccus sp.]
MRNRSTRLCLQTLPLQTVSLTLSLFTSATFASDYTLQNNRWSLIAVPANSSTQTVEQLFGDDLPASSFGQDWTIYTFDREEQGFVEAAVETTLAQGDGFWMFQRTGTDVTIDLPPGLPDGDAESSSACATTDGCFSAQLFTNSTGAWSLLGSPYSMPVDITQIRVVSSNGSCTDGCDLEQARTAGFLSGELWTYNAASGQYEALSESSSLSPWQGVWVRSAALPAETNVELLLPKPSTAENGIARYYGNPQVMTSLADTQVGDTGNVSYANSVVFPFNKRLVSFRKYFIFVPGNAGGPGYYHGGDGGSIEFSLQTDDGTSAHNPSGNKLARSPNIIGGPPEPNGRGGLYDGDKPPTGAADAVYGCDATDDANFRTVCFDTPVEITAGTIYHLVAENTGSDPENNFVSMDDIFTRNGTDDRKAHAPLFDDLDFRVAYQFNGNWIHRKEFVAIVEYLFDDGTSWGNGYMEVSSTPDSPSERASKWLNPQQDIRQTFIPATDFAALNLSVAAMHYSGTNTVEASISDATGQQLWSGQIKGYPTGDVQGEPGRWSGYEAIKESRFRSSTFPNPIQLLANQTYQITLRSTGGSHVIPGARDGAVSSNYFSQSTTVNGAAYYGNAANNRWTEWEIGTQPPYSTAGHFDISFYLENQEVDTPLQ